MGHRVIMLWNGRVAYTSGLQYKKKTRWWTPDASRMHFPNRTCTHGGWMDVSGGVGKGWVFDWEANVHNRTMFRWFITGLNRNGERLGLDSGDHNNMLNPICTKSAYVCVCVCACAYVDYTSLTMSKSKRWLNRQCKHEPINVLHNE